MDALLAQTKAELEQVKGELAARERAIRLPMIEAEKKVAELESAIAETRKQVNEVKLASNRMRPRGPFLTRTASIVRIGLAILAVSCGVNLQTSTFWFTLAPAIVLIVSLLRAPDE